ncbi:MAG: hypothetical protein IJ544_07050 [Prevotella sp.]|nr:hypothetical protein [Prevotella sp.]
MEKIAYQAPEMVVVELKYESPLLDTSGETAGGGSTGFAPEMGEIEE